jgi:chitinase
MRAFRFTGLFLLVAFLFLARDANAQSTPAWKPGIEYSVGELVSFNGTTYKCVQAHTSDNSHQPPDVPGLWQALTSGANCQAVPDAPTEISAYSTTSSSTTLSWKPATVAANCTVTGYTVYQNGVSVAQVASTTFTARHLAPAMEYTFTVAAIDSVGTSAQSTPAPMTTKQAPTCTQPPAAPTDLAATSTTNTGTTLIWTAPETAEGCDVRGYAVFKNGVHLGTATGPHFTVTGLSPSTTYSFTVAGTDSAGNSAPSAPTSVTTKSEP